MKNSENRLTVLDYKCKPNMTTVNNIIEEPLTRRDFFKISSLAIGGLTIGSLSDVTEIMARDAYPSKKITYVVPNKAGGGFDLYARASSPYIMKYLKQLSPGARGGEILIKNEPAASGRKGLSMIYKAKPDGYTIGIIDDAASISDLITGELEFDHTKLTFLHMASSMTRVILSSNRGLKKSFNHWNEVMSAMKKAPVTMAAGPFGRANHVSAIVFNEIMGLNFKLINFQGTVECLNALIRGDVALVIANEDSSKGLIDAKEVKVLLVFDEISKYTEAVTVKELGHPELIKQINSHRYVIAPPSLESEPKKDLIKAMQRTTDDKEFISRVSNSDYNLGRVYGDEAQKMFLQFIKSYEDFSPILKRNMQL